MERNKRAERRETTKENEITKRNETTQRTKRTSSAKKWNFAILVLFIIAAVITGTYAKYTSNATGSGNASIAKWSVKIDGTNMNNIATGELQVPLTYNSSAYTSENKIAPGDSASFTLVIDPTGSEVAIDYTIAVGAVTGLTNNGSNVALTSATYTVQGGTAQNATITNGAATINFKEALADVVAGKTVTVVGTIEWVDDGTTNSADTENGFDVTSLTATLSLTAEQHIYQIYTVEFNANNGTGTMSNQEIEVGMPTALTTNTFTRTGYVFAGWNTSADGNGITYADGASVTNIAAANGTTTLYAQWKVPPVKYAVQIYGINEDVDANGNTLGLTFGPATGEDYNSKYTTHRYQDNGNGTYTLIRQTYTVGNSTPTEETMSVTRTAAEIETYGKKLHDMTWAQIAAESNKEVFTDSMLCGDTKSVELTLNSTIASGTKPTQTGDGAGMLYSTIKHTTDAYYRNWNPSQSQNAYVGTGVTLNSDEISYGSNARNAGGYSSSHIRATLIGENAKTNRGYAGNVNLTEANCLYSCIESDLQSVITAKKVKYVTYTSGNYNSNDDMADKIWLFSEREVYGTASYSGTTKEGLGSSGVGYSRFSNTASKYYESSSYNTSSTANRTAYNESGSTSYWWLRSPYLSYTDYARSVSSSGNVYRSCPYGGLGLAFGFCI